MFKTLRWRATALHLGIGLTVSIFLAVVVFFVWYPAPLHQLAGGTHLFFVLLAVDLVLGPCLTFIVFGGRKSIRERVIDALVIVALQMVALVYGMHALFEARPMALVYEYSKLTVLRAVEVPDDAGREFLARIKTRFNGLPVIGLRPFSSAEESMRYTFEALNGAPLQARRELWTAVEQTDLSTSRAGQDLGRLGQDLQYKLLFQSTYERARKMGISEADLRFLPITDRDQAWTAVFVVSPFQMIELVSVDPYEGTAK